MHAGLQIRVELDPDPPNPREEAGLLGRLACWGRYAHLSELAVLNHQDAATLAAAYEAKVWLPLCATEQGGLSTPTAEHQHQDGLAQPTGIIYATTQDIRQRLRVWRVSRRSRGQASAIMQMEVEDYDCFLRGEMYLSLIHISSW